MVICKVAIEVVQLTTFTNNLGKIGNVTCAPNVKSLAAASDYFSTVGNGVAGVTSALYMLLFRCLKK